MKRIIKSIILYGGMFLNVITVFVMVLWYAKEFQGLNIPGLLCMILGFILVCIQAFALSIWFMGLKPNDAWLNLKGDNNGDNG